MSGLQLAHEFGEQVAIAARAMQAHHAAPFFEPRGLAWQRGGSRVMDISRDAIDLQVFVRQRALFMRGL